MPLNSKIYEVTQMMQDRSAMQNDMAEAMGVVQNMFRDKYISRFHDAIKTHSNNVQSKPPREVQLMQAMKAFMPSQKHKSMDNAIDMIMMMNTAQSIRDELRTASMYGAQPGAAAPYMDASMHPDGIYDMDAMCLSDKNGKRGMQSASGNMTEVLLMLCMIGMI